MTTLKPPKSLQQSLVTVMPSANEHQKVPAMPTTSAAELRGYSPSRRVELKSSKFKIAAVFFALFMGSLEADQLPEKSFRVMVADTGHIVVADVIAIAKHSTTEDYSWHNAVAVLETVKVLKGTLTEERIEVLFHTGLACPTPARYVEGARVLAFLDRMQTSPYFTTHALSYGLRDLADGDQRIYETRILEIQEIAQTPIGSVRENLTRDWLVRCAVESATRWEGVYELSGLYSRFAGYGDRGEGGFTKSLTPTQITEISNALSGTSRFQINEVSLARLLLDDPPDDLANLLATRLDSGQSLWLSKQIMEIIVELTGSTYLADLAHEYETFDGNGAGCNSKRQEIIMEFLELTE